MNPWAASLLCGLADYIGGTEGGKLNFPTFAVLFSSKMGFLSLKEVEKYDLDDPRRTLAHKEIIHSKKFLHQLYLEWYGLFKEKAASLPQGHLIELGSGGGFIKDIMPQVITSDVMELPGVDQVFPGENMPFADGSVAGIFMIDVFHHIPQPASFLKEASRVLAPGGKIIMSEPANSAWGRFIYRNFHHEPFEPKGGWEIPSTGPLSGANGALPWIFFERDRKEFEKQFPGLKITSIRYHTPLRYLVSGGVSKKQLLPDFAYGMVKGLEGLLLKISPQLSMFMTIEITRQ
jgi:SAM-dependent methyltransferase